jgi:AcrR family transcriptional regulator
LVITQVRPLDPRKLPVQTRSTATLAVLHTAAIQVLSREGLARCTTTRVAERAGISVGSLYQYYPNRDALLAGVLDHHLEDVALGIEQTCQQQRGTPAATMAAALVSSFLAVKFSDPDAARALYAVASERGGPEKVQKAQRRIISAIAFMLATAPESAFDHPDMVAAVAFNAMVGPVLAVLQGNMQPEDVPHLEAELSTLIGGYFAAYGVRPTAST